MIILKRILKFQIDLNHLSNIQTQISRAMTLLLSVICFAFLGIVNLHATHNQSGEITYVQVGDLTIEAKITTYTRASSEGADRDSLMLFWGDGSSEYVVRSNGTGEVITGTDIKKNEYVALHTYPGRATYTLSFTDPNRVSGILNVNFPNSVDVPFYLETTFTLLNPQFEGQNSSAVMLQAPVDFACVNTRFIHNPNAFDPDGDSLAYEIIEPLSSEGMNVPQYLFPNQVNPGPNNAISLDPVTGDFVWESPQTAGQYNIAFRVNEFRNGTLINSIVRDMTIFVDVCDFQPPVINAPNEICVIAGELVEFDVNVDDPDVGDLVILSATGGPFSVDVSPAELLVNNAFQEVPFTAQFRWQTTCEHISPQTYQIVLRAQDNAAGETAGLADLKTIRITVLGPPPLDVEVEELNNNFEISWESPYECEDAMDEYFIGFSVWRRINSNNFERDSCEFGLDGRGYQPVVFLTNEQADGRYFFIDDTAEDGILYCYRVLAEFALRTTSGNPFNRVPSIPSEEVCRLKNRNFPFLLNVSVETTDELDGDMFVRWTKPDPEDLDTLVNTGPYEYQLQFTEIDENTFVDVPGALVSSESFGEVVDSNFTQIGLNTLEEQYNYQVLFRALGSGFESVSPNSSSIFLTLDPGDERIVLSWQAQTSWQNSAYTIFRQLPGNSEFDSLTTVLETTTFEDLNLENELDYCYFIRSEGSYGLDNISSPLINDSQEACAIPIDTDPPCVVNLEVETPCLQNTDSEEVINVLSWNNASIFCPDGGDAVGYHIFYGLSPDDLEIIARIEDVNTISFQHTPLIGSQACYAVSTFDFLGNESELSEVVCVDNCPTYELPNTFTPNGDGANDLFVPISSRFIASVRFNLYNRWGNLIYQTEDPQLNWDGKNLNGEEMDEGVYYYTCELFGSEQQGTERQTNLLEGFIQLIKSN